MKQADTDILTIRSGEGLLRRNQIDRFCAANTVLHPSNAIAEQQRRSMPTSIGEAT